MNHSHAVQRALLSVSDKSGLVEFAKVLAGHGVEIVSTGGTAKALMAAGIAVVPVEKLTGFPEMMDGRVKTLHPRVHGGLLGRRDVPEHVAAMKEHGIAPIDLVCVSLYPFANTIAKAGVTEEDAIEQIDIGGPAMIRSASKNYEFVTVVTAPEQYARVAKEMAANKGGTTLTLRKQLAAEAFDHTAKYDTMIAAWMARANANVGASELPDTIQVALTRKTQLRYGENPHQTAALYRDLSQSDGAIVDAQTVEGKPLSYNNILDAAAAFELVKDLLALTQRATHANLVANAGENTCAMTAHSGAPLASGAKANSVAACVVKHTNPCGAAIGANAADAFDKAYAGDPLAAYGGIVAISARLTAADATNIAKPDRFLEVVVAESFEPEAIAILAARWKNVRLLAVGSMHRAPTNALQLRSVPGGVLVQESDGALDAAAEFKLTAGPAPSEALRQDAEFLSVIAKHLKSNAVCVGAQQTLWGAGAGQMDRVASCKHAIEKAKLKLQAAIAIANTIVVTAASDAFFPFDDGPRLLIDAGVKCLVHPGGSKRDGDTETLCKNRGVTLLVTGTRHFRH
ncbi:MAG: bifunctional phosphoribosylaminoimidazolecarboxamide formyltransferase/IMP cyclohydrolase [Phycisphaerales bacterium]|nr:bifunctional phosphoribosylaminoimidazolecarboxamide formyltransferase/IMP cyclohydrolase [Phycisphaerales bacterium]